MKLRVRCTENEQKENEEIITDFDSVTWISKLQTD